jgi:hypothetical protein
MPGKNKIVNMSLKVKDLTKVILSWVGSLFIIRLYKSISGCICGFINLFFFIYKSMIIRGVSYVKEDKNSVLRSSSLKSKIIKIKVELLGEKQRVREPKKKEGRSVFQKSVNRESKRYYRSSSRVKSPQEGLIGTIISKLSGGGRSLIRRWDPKEVKVCKFNYQLHYDKYGVKPKQVSSYLEKKGKRLTVEEREEIYKRYGNIGKASRNAIGGGKNLDEHYVYSVPLGEQNGYSYFVICVISSKEKFFNKLKGEMDKGVLLGYSEGSPTGKSYLTSQITVRIREWDQIKFFKELNEKGVLLEGDGEIIKKIVENVKGGVINQKISLPEDAYDLMTLPIIIKGLKEWKTMEEIVKYVDSRYYKITDKIKKIMEGYAKDEKGNLYDKKIIKGYDNEDRDSDEL